MGVPGSPSTSFFQSPFLPCTHAPHPKWALGNGTPGGITSRFPLAFRRTLWVTTTGERERVGLLDADAQGETVRAGCREEALTPNGPESPVHEPKDPEQGEEWKLPVPRHTPKTTDSMEDGRPSSCSGQTRTSRPDGPCFR